MVDGDGSRLALIKRGDWSDGLERQGSNPWSTTKLSYGELIYNNATANDNTQSYCYTSGIP
jgi:hypothetical protein